MTLISSLQINIIVTRARTKTSCCFCLQTHGGHFCVFVVFPGAGGNTRGTFALAPGPNDGWKVFVKQPLDREEQDRHLLTVTASDGLFTTQAVVEVTVTDANDNSPVCTQVRIRKLHLVQLFS